MEITYKNGAPTIRLVKYVCWKRPFSNDFVQNLKEFVAEGTWYRFGATHPYVNCGFSFAQFFIV